jgi:Uma2 family endonuclease
MNEPTLRRASYEDVLAAPPDKIAEIIHGVLHLSPRPGGAQIAAGSALGGELGPPFKRGRGGPGGWSILDKPELHLADHILVPDLAGWRRERMPLLPRTAHITLNPDWVCEILSPRTARLDRTEKKPLYANLGVAYLWLVDPEALTLETYQLMEGRWVDMGAYCKNDRPRAVPFGAIELDLGALWADVEPPEE